MGNLSGALTAPDAAANDERATGIGADTQAARLAAALREQEAALVELWWLLGASGPTLGSELAGEPEDARARYLVPLARTLEGALAGSATHRAAYLDERVRYGTPPEVTAVLDEETAAIAQLVADRVDPEVTTALLDELHGSLTHPDTPRRSMLFLGDCLFVELRASLVPALRAKGLPVHVDQLFFSANQAIPGRESAIVREVAERKPDIIGISLFTFEGVPMYSAAMRAVMWPWSTPDMELARSLVDLVAQQVAQIREVSEATIVVHSPSGLLLDPLHRRLPDPLPNHSRAQRLFLGEIRRGLAALVDGTTNTILFDEQAEVARTGLTLRAAQRALFDHSDVPAGYAHSTRLGSMLAERHGEIVAAHDLFGRAKALFVDFDNTLWKGVMAEGPVQHDLALQRMLKQLRQAGVLLVALSKNDPAQIRWDEMVLEPDDFVLHKISWQPKPDAAAQAIAELDLAPSAFVLLDDNPVERALVTEHVPGVRALDPTDPQTTRLLELWFEFPSTRQTEESARRTEMYREAAERRQAMTGAHDYASMMRSLDLRCEVRPATEADTDRLLELVQRTNQFNTTTRRRSAAEVAELLHDEDVGVRVATLGDRFGDLGVVGVTVFDRRGPGFDSVIMSCRAMGFGLEQTMLRATLDDELRRDPSLAAREVHGAFVPTDRNGPAAGLFRDGGFTEGEAGDWVLAPGADGPHSPEWMRVRS